MPKSTRVERCVNKLKKESPEKNPYAICQDSTGQSYATGKSVTKEGKAIKKRKSKMEARNEKFTKFLKSMKTEENTHLIESVLKAYNICFEVAEGAQFLLEDEITVDEETHMKMPDTEEEVEEVKDKMDEIVAAETTAEVKKEELQDITDDENAY